MMIQFDAVRWVFVGCLCSYSSFARKYVVFFLFFNIFQHYSCLLQLHNVTMKLPKRSLKNHVMSKSRHKHVATRLSHLQSHYKQYMISKTTSTYKTINNSFVDHFFSLMQRVGQVNYIKLESEILCWFDKLV